MQLPASAGKGQSVMLDDLKSDGRHIDDLAAIPYLRLLCRPQRTRLLGQTVGRWRLARIVAVHAQLRFDRIQGREQRINET
ncbi:MAG: hypothetical protein H7335_10710, partial [Massilia sp.]|nr:hypothetical protein [Massilia sp.]